MKNSKNKPLKEIFAEAFANYKKRDLRTAENFCYKILNIEPNHFDSIFLLATIYAVNNNFDKAKQLLHKAIEIQPNNVHTLNNLGTAYKELEDNKEAINYYNKVLKIDPYHTNAHYNLGLVFYKLKKLEEAKSYLHKALKIKPNHAGVYHNLALAYKEIGDFENAIKSHKSALKSEPDNSMHYFYLSMLKKDILNETLKNKIQKILINNNCTKTNLAYGNFVLAKYENKIKNFTKELDYLKKGHQYFFDTKKEKFKLGIKYCFDDVLQISEGANIAKSSNHDDYKIKPIFIIGVPRCGSTVLEKILASGKKLVPMGEETSVIENFFTKKVLEKQSLNLGDLKTIRNELYEIYEKKKLISKKYDFTFTDKSLNNFFYLDLIKTIYPNAKIINCKRDYLSSIVSIFQNNLTELAWTHNLENIFKYFDNYIGIIKNFTDVYPNFIYDLQFEKLVNNPKDESKKLMKFCELPWDKKCLEFYKRKDLISKTASNVQIRQGIYKHSLDKYLPYKKFLEKNGNKYSWFN